MTTTGKTSTQPESFRRKKRALWLVLAAMVIWLGFAISDSLKDPTPPAAPKALKSFALRHVQAESENAFWTGGDRK